MLQTVSKPLTRIRILSVRLSSPTAFMTSESRKLPFCGTDKIEFCKFREPDLLALGESMPDRHDRDELVGPVGQDLKSGRRKIAAENADVRRILSDRANDLLARALFEIDADCAVNGEEVGEVAREMLKDRRYARVNSHPAAETRRMLRELGFHLLQVAHDDPRVPQQGLRGSGRLETLGRAVKQRRLDQLFKVRNSLADRRGGDMLSGGRARNAFAFADRDEQFQR